MKASPAGHIMVCSVIFLFAFSGFPRIETSDVCTTHRKHFQDEIPFQVLCIRNIEPLTDCYPGESSKPEKNGYGGNRNNGLVFPIWQQIGLTSRSVGK